MQFGERTQFGKRRSKSSERGRFSMSTNQFGVIVILASLLMLAIGIATAPNKFGEEEVADSDLERAFAPAAGGNQKADEAEDKDGFSIKRSMRKRMQ